PLDHAGRCRCASPSLNPFSDSAFIVVGDNGLFFFFQAEDGIRDLYVTGVQTCALPISHALQCLLDHIGCGADVVVPAQRNGGNRSEERRVGKEWRYRWSPYN